MIRVLLLALALSLMPAFALGQVPPSARQASNLQSDLIVATREDDVLRGWLAWREGAAIDTVTELRPGTPAFVIARVRGCMTSGGSPGVPNAPARWGGSGRRCNVSIDYTIYKPDGSVYRELKLQPFEEGKTPPSLRFTLGASDPSGLYRVVGTIRDLNARRTQRPERIFSLRID